MYRRIAIGMACLTIFLLSACVDTNPQSEIIPAWVEENSLNQDFLIFQRSVSVSDELTVPYIRSLEIGPEGEFLFVSGQAGAAVLDENGNLLQRLSPQQCPEPHTWSPYNAVYSPNGGIFVQVNANDEQPNTWGYYFDNAYTCITPADSSFRGGDHATFFDDDNLFRLHERFENGEHETQLLHSAANGRSKFFNHLSGPFDEFPGVNYRAAGGGMDIIGTEVFTAFVTEPTVFVYSLSGDLRRVIGDAPPFFRRIPEDIPVEIGMQRNSNVGELLRSTQWVTQLHAVNQSTLVFQIMHGTERRYATEFYDTNGQSQLKSPWPDLGSPVRAAKDGLVYFVERGKNSNATIHIFRFETDHQE